MGILNFNNYISEEKKKGRDAAGIAIIYKNKILLVHPTGSSWKKGTCGIPKGGMESGEDPLETAIRELYEETGIIVTPQQLDLSPETVTVHSGPEVWNLIYFVCKIEDLSEIGLESERIPKSQLQLKEVDWAKFVGPDEAYPIVSRRQLIILDRHLSLR